MESIMKPCILFLLLFCTSALTAFAQHEADNWYFGDRAGLVFKNDTVESVIGGQTRPTYTWNLGFTSESASISDKKTGNLLFYTDGLTVWNRKHKIINYAPYQLGGRFPKVIIVPNPADSKLYYVFTISVRDGDDPAKEGVLQYSVVSIDNPDGELRVINSHLMDSVSRLSATLDCAGTGYWVAVSHLTKCELYTFHVTESGVNPVPVVSNYRASILAEGINDPDSVLVSCIKFSPDRTKFALASVKPGMTLVSTESIALILFDFNPETGVFTNSRLLNSNKRMYLCYHLSFSPDNTKLYVSGTIPNSDSSVIFQFDLSQPDLDSIKNSISIVSAQPSRQLETLQLAPDGKIYVSKTGIPGDTCSIIDIIEKPNLKHPAYSYKINAISLLPVKPPLDISSYAYFASNTPSFMDYIFNQPIPGKNPLAWCMKPRAATVSDSGCLGSTFRFVDKSTRNPVKREWLFENGTPSVSSASTVDVTYTQVGTHRVRLIATNENGSDTVITQAVVFPVPIASAGDDRTVCTGNSAKLGMDAEAGVTYSWRPTIHLDDASKPNPVVTPAAAGVTQYILTAKNTYGCISYDTVVITAGRILSSISKDTAICIGSSVQLTAANGGDKYSWSPVTGLNNPNIRNPIATPLSTTTYTLTASTGVCFDSDSVTITVNPAPIANAGTDKFICSRDKAIIGSDSISGNTYSWLPIDDLDNPNSANPIASPHQTTTYFLKVTNGLGCIAYDTVVLFVDKVVVSNDTSICFGSNVQLYASGGTNYQWSPSIGLSDPTSANPIASPNSTTRYVVYTQRQGCIDSAAVTVTVFAPPIVDAGKDTIFCKGDALTIGTPPIAGNSYSWTPTTGLTNPNEAQTTVSPNQTISYVLTAANANGCIAKDTILLSVFSSADSIFTLLPQIVPVLPGQIFQTTLNIPNGVRTWLVNLEFDRSVIKFNSILNTSNGVIASISKEHNGTVSLQGSGGDGDVVLQFTTFLPYSPDTLFAISLKVDDTQTESCNNIIAKGNVVALGEYCSKNIRRVNIFGKFYFLKAAESNINFSIGIPGKVRLELYDYTGTLKEVLADRDFDAGKYSIDLDLPTGVYFCRINAGIYNDVQKIMILPK